MPRSPLHALIWSPDQGFYELYTQGQLEQRFRPGDEASWLAWLGEVTSFAFQGEASSLNVYQEARGRAGQYWYAYHTTGSRTHKRYLGRTARVSLGHLEETARALSNEYKDSSPPLAGSPTRHQVEQSTTLPSTKLAAPRLPGSPVQRERLLAELEGALSVPLTLLSASAGWGKTTLLSLWGSLHPNQVAWLSLDSLDNEPFRFWAAVIAALRTRLPGVGALALAMLHSPQPPPFSALLTALLNDLAEVEEPATPLVLLLDDYQVIDDQAVHETLAFWGEHLPAHVHLLLSSRVDPDLPLSRWRLRGQLLEIRTDDLRFRPDEASVFLRQTMGLSLSEAEVAALSIRTEGWVAGLQVAALSLRKREDASAWLSAFTGGHRYVLDYVQQEILRLQPEPIRRFLLQVAVLRRMNAAVCQAVTGEPASQDFLETLERSNLFVVPLDEQRQWYRMHDLFREALLARLQASQPDLLPQVHQRAAQWYEAQGELREAIAHLLEARDFSSAAVLMEREAEGTWLNGEVKTLYRWIMALPDPVVGEHALLVLTAALYLLNAAASTTRTQRVRAQKEAEQLMARVQAVLGHQENDAKAQTEREKALPAAQRTLLQQRLRLLRAWSAAFEMVTINDCERLRLIAQEMQNLDREDEVAWQMIPLSTTFILRHTFQLEGASLVPVLLEAKQRVIQTGDHFAIIKVMQWLALSYFDAGQLRLAHQECVVALDLITQVDGHTILAGYFYLCLAHISYQWNQLDEAQITLRKMIHDAHAWQQVDLQVFGYLLLVQAMLSAGDLSSAQLALQQAEALVQQERMATAAFWVEAARVRYWLAANDLEAAGDWAEQMAFSPETWDPNHNGAFLMQVRVFLARQQYPQAIEALERFGALLDRPGDIETTIEFLALQVIALHDGGKHEQVQAVAARLLSLTEPEGNIRVFLDQGEPMKQLLKTLLAAPHEQAHRPLTHFRSFVAKLLAAFEHEEQQGRTSPRTETPLSQAPDLPGRSPSPSLVPVEPLTRREQEVLRLLVAGRTYAEMAEALVVSPNTIKTQVSRIYRKLGVSRRAEVIAVTARLHLL